MTSITNTNTTSLLGRVSTRQPYAHPASPLQVFHVTLENDQFLVFASCEALVRMVVLDRCRLKKLPGTKARIKIVGPAMTMKEETL